MTNESSVNHYEKIQIVARRLKFAVWIFCALVLAIFLIGLVFGTMSITIDDEWLGEEVTQALIANSLFPTAMFDGLSNFQLALVGLLMYWLQRLLSCFERGAYFSNHSVRCCLWISWIFISLLVIPFLQKMYLYYLSQRFLPEMDMSYNIDVELGSLVLLILLPMIIYMLRAAQSVELENREFV